MSRLSTVGLAVLAAIHHMPDGRILRVEKLAGSTRSLDRLLRDTPDHKLLGLRGPVVSVGQSPLDSILGSFSPPMISGGAESGAIGAIVKMLPTAYKLVSTFLVKISRCTLSCGIMPETK